MTAANSQQIYRRYQDLQRYVGWSEDDARRIRRAAAIVKPHFAELIDDFYAEIDRHEETRRVITGGAEQIARLKKTLAMWVSQLFTGPYDEQYVSRRWRVGWRHVEIGLHQAYTNAALSRLRNGLLHHLAGNWGRDRRNLLLTIESLNKLLDLDLAIIQDAYEAERIRREKQAERQRGEATFRNLVETASCMIVILRDDYSIAYLSPYAERLTGYSAAEVLDQDYLTVFVRAEDQRSVAQAIDQALAGGQVRGYQNDVLCRDGSHRSMMWNAQRLDHYEEQPVCLAIGHDVTSLQEAQEKALQSERLAAIGQMSTGLAHESRNALQRIQASAEVLELVVEDNEEAMKMIQQIQAGQQHLHRLFDEVKGYAAPIMLDRSDTPLSAVWREAWEVLGSQRVSREVQLTEHVGDVNLTCSIDRFRMVQVFRNLLENSLAACSDPAEITIACTESELHGRPAIELRFRDNGPGFSRDQRERVFAPFYTTKPKGTGLGMAIARRIIEAHGGRIEIGNIQSPGAEILITLPQNATK